MQRMVLRAAFLVSLSLAGLMLIAVTLGGVAVVRDSMGPNQLVVPLGLALRADAQVFFDRGEGIRAEDCVTRAVAGGREAEIRFALPRERIRELRLDPMVGAGEFTVGAPRLETRSGRVVARFSITAVVPRHQIAEFRRDGDRWVGTTTSDANDPQLTLDLRAPLPPGQIRVPWLEAVGLLITATVAIALRRHPANRDWRLPRPRAASVVRIGLWLSGSSRTGVLCGLLLVAAVELGRLWPLHQTVDWPLWDEANYAGAGAAWARTGGSLGALHESPVYVLTYALLASISGVADAIMAQHYLLKLGSVLLLYLLLTRWTRSWLGAAGIALWWGASQFQLEFPLLVYHGAWVWFLLALLCLDKWPLTGVILMAAATATRQEYQFALAATIGWLAWEVWRQRTNRSWLVATSGPRWIGTVTLSASLAVVALVVAKTRFQGASGRAWFAFQQHYAVRAQAEGEAPNINPWLEYANVVRRDFGAARSLREAWENNPSALLRHVGYNLRHVGSELAVLVEPHPRVGVAIGWLAAAGVLILATKRREQPEGNSTRASRLLAVSGLLVVMPSLLVLAKGAYLLPLVALLLGFGCWLMQRMKVPEWSGIWLLSAGIVAAVVTLAIEVTSPRVFVSGERPRPVADTVQALQAIWPEAGKHALLGVAASSYAHYLDTDRCDGREAIGAVSGRPGLRFSLTEAVADPQLHAVLVTSDWRGLGSFDQAEFDATLVPPAWLRRDVAAGTLYWRATPR